MRSNGRMSKSVQHATAQVSTGSTDGFLRLPQILDLIPIAASTWWLWISQGKAPRGVKISPRVTVWSRKSISQFIEKFSQGDAA